MGSRAPSAAGSRGGPPSLIPTRSAGRISFSATSPSRRRIACGLGDFTYLRCWEGVLYFSFVIDVFLRMIVGWQLASHMRTDLVLDALRMALGLRAPGADFELVADTDAGSQYTSADYTQVLDDHRVLASIGSAGDADDNALAESFVDSDKTELIADRVWRSRTQLELAAVEYVSWFNHDPLHESLGPDRVRSPKRPDIARPVSGGDLSEGRRRAENASRLDARRRFPRQQPDLSRQRSRCSRSGFAQAAPTAGQGTKGGPWPLRSTVQSHTG